MTQRSGKCCRTVSWQIRGKGADGRVSPVNKGKGQEVEDRRGVQSTVQHDGGGFEFEDIAGQRWVTGQTVLGAVEGETPEINTSVFFQHSVR